MEILVNKPHPWHGIDLYDEPNILNAFIELVPSDNVKYEIDKKTGYLKIDRPQKYSNIFPSLYGFLPKTFCGKRVAEYSAQKINRPKLVGDGDPLDICVLTESTINHGDVIVNATPIGGFRMIDQGEVDDKIIAVLKDDPLYGEVKELSDCRTSVINRLRHYFLTYKEIPTNCESPAKCEITSVYDSLEAMEVIELASKDYQEKFYNSIC
ncbi:MAG: inorganic pyrophosphatase [Oligoflexales bacterium]